MVARSAYAQLRCSPLLLFACTLVVLAVHVLPLAVLPLTVLPLLPTAATLPAARALVAVTIGYVRTLRCYGMSPLWSLLLPLVAILYLAMTWDAARRHWTGVGPEWEGRLSTRAEP